MAKTLTATLDCLINWQYANDEEISAPVDSDRNRSKNELAAGSSANQVEIMYRERVTVTPSTPNHDLDLSGVLADVFGDTLTFTRAVAVLINNLTTTTGNHLIVGAAAANPWTAPFNGSGTATARCGAGSPLVLADLVDGYTVSAGSSDTLRVAHNGVSSDDIEFDIVILGHSTA